MKLMFRIIGPTLAMLELDARRTAARFYDVAEDDHRLVVDFLGAVPYLSPAALREVGEWPDGIVPHGEDWCARFDAVLTDEHPVAHAAHPNLRRIMNHVARPGTLIGETMDGVHVATLTSCGCTSADFPHDGTFTIQQVPPGTGWTTRVLAEAGVTCQQCLDFPPVDAYAAGVFP